MKPMNTLARYRPAWHEYRPISRKWLRRALLWWAALAWLALSNGFFSPLDWALLGIGTFAFGLLFLFTLGFACLRMFAGWWNDEPCGVLIRRALVPQVAFHGTVLATVILCTLFEVPFRLAFEFHRPALERRAERLMKESSPENSHDFLANFHGGEKHPEWIGLLHVVDIDAGPSSVYFILGGFIDPEGLVYAPGREMEGDPVLGFYCSHFRGSWWRFRQSW